jgi:DNA polymerase-1
MIEIDKFLTKKDLKKDVKLLLQVHDELVYEIKEGIVDSVVPEIQRMMEGVIDPKKTHGIVCVAEAKMGDNWKDMVKI